MELWLEEVDEEDTPPLKGLKYLKNWIRFHQINYLDAGIQDESTSISILSR